MNIQKKLYYFLILFCISSISIATNIKEQYPFSKVIVWGHKIQNGHTHSWIHYAFYKAFTHLGYDTLWLDNNDNIDHIDFAHSLFITEGQVDQKIPKQADCRYILHNCNTALYKHLFDLNNCIILQVFTYDIFGRNIVEKAPFVYADINDRVLYMPWATDLLPHEINEQKKCATMERSPTIYWVGTMNNDYFGNMKELQPFMLAAQKYGITIKQYKSNNITDSIQAIHQSYMAPAIVGTWQKEKGYIPCRIFKNISYGQMGITNSKAVYELFNKKIVYNANTYQLFFDAQQKLHTMSIHELYDLMDFVRDHHTYITRIDQLLSFMSSIKPIT